jgi:DamX protein
MAEIDTSARVQPSWNDKAGAPAQFLLTPERAQVLDLLLHLIANSADSILLCGPEGVGKSKLLQILQSHEIPGGSFCFVEGDPELNLEAIQQHLDESFNPEPRGKHAGNLLNAAAERGAPRKKKVLILDEAGSLAPGLITALLRYAERNPQIRVILALTHDQLHLKYRTDPIIEENCHIVEFPPLTEKQCGEFLLHLSAKTASGIAADTLTDSRISLIFRQTHGIPARIIAGYSVPAPRKRPDRSSAILVTSVAVLVVVALAVQWFSSRQAVPKAKQPNPAAALPQDSPEKSPAIDFNLPYLTFPKLEPADTQPNTDLQFGNSGKAHQGSGAVLPDLSPKPAATSGAEAAPDSTVHLKPEAAGQTPPENSRTTEASMPPAQELKPAESQPGQEAVPAEAGADDSSVGKDASDWLSSQPQDRYTLQLMVLSRRQSILDVMKKYSSLQRNFRYVRRMIQNKEKFVLLYGSFTDAESANKARKTLPAEFQKAMTRKIGAIQKEFGLLAGNR